MNDIRPAILLFVAFTILCGGIYPSLVTGIAQTVFPHQANGSPLADRSGRVVGSALIGQPFTDPKYFWPRPSATAEFGYNPLASGGSNLGPTNPDLLRQVGERVKNLRAAGLAGPVPADLVLASASGLDPHITPAAARLQTARVATARGVGEDVVAKLVADHTEDRQFGILGEPRVNVLALNLALDKLTP
ncbi:MAG: potassium-transporting ATPase subunit KdpC [Desulfuromonadales bacterium]|nr:MAG: potassium-transporting ATPase subunit KdpC [Desulfuromonadales bacterium]